MPKSINLKEPMAHFIHVIGHGFRSLYEYQETITVVYIKELE